MSEFCLVGRIGSGVQVSTSFQNKLPDSIVSTKSVSSFNLLMGIGNYSAPSNNM